MRRHHLVLAICAALALSACGGKETQTAGLENVPDEAGLTLDISNGSGVALTEAPVAAGSAMLDQTPVVQDDLARAREKVAAVNQAVREVFGHVAEVVKAEGAPAQGDTKTYGPMVRCVVADTCDQGGSANLRLKVHRAFGATWAFSLEAEVGAEWKPVLAGWLRRATEARRGVGRIAVNLDNLRAAAPAYDGQGQLLGGFANGAVAKTVHYHLVAFTPDPARWPAATAAYRGFKTPAGVTRVRVAGIENLYGGAGSQDELGFGHVAYDPAVGGRAFAVVTNYRSAGTMHGDVPRSSAGAEQYFFGRACYAPGVPGAVFKEWFLCERGVGPRACIAAQGGAGTPVLGAANLSWQTSCAIGAEPAELQPPDAAPAATPEDGSDETGAAAVGLVPEAPPTSAQDVTP